MPHERIEDYLFSSMDEADVSRFEDALFEDPDTTGVVRDLLALVDAAHRIHESETTLSMTTTTDALARFEASGRTVQRYPMREDQPRRVPLTPDVALVVGRLQLDLAGVRRVDLEFLDVDGTSRGKRTDDVDVDRAESCVWVPCAPSVALASRATLFRLHAHREDGSVTAHDYIGIVADEGT